MAGGFAVIKEVPKTMVYEVCRFINRSRAAALIPRARAGEGPYRGTPAEPEGQRLLAGIRCARPDPESLCGGRIEFDEMLADGLRPQDRGARDPAGGSSEYKRRQAPPGVKITERGLGKDRRFPITNLVQELLSAPCGERGASRSRRSRKHETFRRSEAMSD